MTEVEKPVPKPTEVLIKVESIGLNYAEILSRKGQYRWAPKRPYIPGMEAYGEVMEIGSQVTTRKVGDKVIIGKQYGCYAEYTCAEQHLCFSAFENFNAEENAAYLVNFMTAWVQGRTERVFGPRPFVLLKTFRRAIDFFKSFQKIQLLILQYCSVHLNRKRICSCESGRIPPGAFLPSKSALCYRRYRNYKS